MFCLFKKKRKNLIPISYQNYIDSSGSKPDKNGNKSGAKSHTIMYYNYDTGKTETEINYAAGYLTNEQFNKMEKLANDRLQGNT